MKKLEINEMEVLEGGKDCVGSGFACGLSIGSIALAIAAPPAGTALAMLGGFSAGFGAGYSCADFIACLNEK